MPNLQLAKFPTFDKLDFPTHRHLHTVAAPRTNPSFTSSHIFTQRVLRLFNKHPNRVNLPTHNHACMTLGKCPNRVEQHAVPPARLFIHNLRFQPSFRRAQRALAQPPIYTSTHAFARLTQVTFARLTQVRPNAFT